MNVFRYVVPILVCLFVHLLPIAAGGYGFLGVPDGLSDRRVLSIQKDSTGFMWFLTYAGIDRYDGKSFKHYQLQNEDGYIAFYSEEGALKTDNLGQVWVIAPKGELYGYDAVNDQFVMVPLGNEIPVEKAQEVDLVGRDEVWYCLDDQIYSYNIHQKSVRQISISPSLGVVSCVHCPSDGQSYYVGSESGVSKAVLRNGKLDCSVSILGPQVIKSPSIIYCHQSSGRLFVASETGGLVVYDMVLKEVEKSWPHLKEFPITSIVPYDEFTLLISTRGSGVYLYDVKKRTLVPQFTLDFDRPDRMNGNNIRSLFKDERGRVWMSVYPKGITFYDKDFPEYTWYINHRGNPKSLSDDQINAVLEDSDGDIWFATNNGLDLYSPEDDCWTHFLGKRVLGISDSLRNSIFLSLCEVRPGVVLAGGFMTGVYSVDKQTGVCRQLTMDEYVEDVSSISEVNNYIRVVHKDSQGLVWTGGNKYLGCTNPVLHTFHKYDIGKAVTCVLEYDSTTLFVGTGDGIYKFNKVDSTFHSMRMPFASQQINTMYLHPNGNFYVGTTYSGLVEIEPDGRYHFYQQLTSALLSNTVNTIVPKSDKELIVATESNVALFDIETQRVVNWTSDQGLIDANFNPRSGIHTRRGTFLFGTGNGAVEWKDTMKMPSEHQTKILLDQVLLENEHITNQIQEVTKDSVPTSLLEFKYAKSLLAFHIAVIDYNNPIFTYLQWKLEGKYDHWSAINKGNWIQFQNLQPGEYTLRIQNVAREDYRVLSEKSIRIVVIPSFWQTGWALILYCSLLVVGIICLLRYRRMRRERRHSKEQVSLMLRTIRCAQTRLSLISSVATDLLMRKEKADKLREENGLQQMRYNADNLQQMFSNLMNVEYQIGKPRLNLSVCALDEFARSVVDSFQSVAKVRGIRLIQTDDTEGIEVTMDEECIRTILFNILSNLIRNCRIVDSIYVKSWASMDSWGFSISNVDREKQDALADDGHPFREIINRRNVHHLEEELHLISMLVARHDGKLVCRGDSPLEYTFYLKFPTKHYPIETVRNEGKRFVETLPFVEWKKIPHIDMVFKSDVTASSPIGSLLVVEDEVDMNAYLGGVLDGEWEIFIARDGHAALQMAEYKRPDVILIDSVLPDMQGTELCAVLKSNVSTSHIPIILLGGSGSVEEAIGGYDARADHMLVKPVNVALLRALLNNVWENRNLLKERMQQFDVVHNLKNIKDVNVERETKFLADIREHINQHVLDANFNVDVLAALMGMSRTSMYNKIKELTGLTPSDMIRDIRMRRAGELLLSDEYNIMEVSDRMGFSEPKYFREVFKKYYGVSPSEYIRTQARRR